MELSPEERDRRGRARAARTQAIYKSEHVKSLTINPTKYIRPGMEKSIVLDRATHHLIEFHLRQMWAICLLQNMQESWGWSWKEIADRTGKSRITWNNVTQTYFLPFDIYNSPDARQQVNAWRDKHRDENGSLEGRVRIGWKPVTKGFIFDVTESLEAWGKSVDCEVSIFTSVFREAFDKGLTVVMNQNTHHDRIILRIGDSVTFDQTEGMGDDHHSSQWLSNFFALDLDDYLYCYKNKEDKPKAHNPFPLLEGIDGESGLHNVWLWMAMFEEQKFDPANSRTGEPPEWCTAWQMKWQLEQDAEDEERQIAEAELGLDDDVHQVDNPLIEPKKKQQFFSDEFKEAIANDNSPHWNGEVDSGKPISIDVLPDMLDEYGDGEVKFTITVKMRSGRRSGYSVEEQPIS